MPKEAKKKNHKYIKKIRSTAGKWVYVYKSKSRNLKQKISGRVQKLIDKGKRLVAKHASKWLSEQMSNAMEDPKVKKEVLGSTSKMLNEQGIDISPDELDELIEEVIKRMNS